MSEECVSSCVYRGRGCLYKIFHGNPLTYIPELVEIGQKCIHPENKKIQGLEEIAEDSQSTKSIISTIQMP